jgi:hypothetical protein
VAVGKKIPKRAIHVRKFKIIILACARGQTMPDLLDVFPRHV